jgi:hypothetical protein
VQINVRRCDCWRQGGGIRQRTAPLCCMRHVAKARCLGSCVDDCAAATVLPACLPTYNCLCRWLARCLGVFRERVAAAAAVAAAMFRHMHQARQLLANDESHGSCSLRYRLREPGYGCNWTIANCAGLSVRRCCPVRGTAVIVCGGDSSKGSYETLLLLVLLAAWLHLLSHHNFRGGGAQSLAAYTAAAA